MNDTFLPVFIMKLEFIEVGHRKFSFFLWVWDHIEATAIKELGGELLLTIELEFLQTEHIVFLESCSEFSEHQIFSFLLSANFLFSF